MKITNKYHCIVCNKEITSRTFIKGTKKCPSCGHKKEYKRCINCNKILKNRRAKRCKSCANKGENNPNYIHGKHINNKKCIDCYD